MEEVQLGKKELMTLKGSRHRRLSTAASAWSAIHQHQHDDHHNHRQQLPSTVVSTVFVWQCVPVSSSCPMFDWPVMEHWFQRYILGALAICVIIGWIFVWIMHLIALFHGYVHFDLFLLITLSQTTECAFAHWPKLSGLFSKVSLALIYVCLCRTRHCFYSSVTLTSVAHVWVSLQMLVALFSPFFLFSLSHFTIFIILSSVESMHILAPLPYRSWKKRQKMP